ncbi:MAG: hypothetical protein O3B41_10670 [Bacteroidetes bacterium]|nr:hypothetical protein [Bacteroidota bacterium]
MPDTKQSIILGGLVAGLLSTSYLGIITCCLGVVVGAVVAVWHYTDTNELTVPTGHGAKIGAFAALIGLLIATVLNFILMQAGINHETAWVEFMISKFGDQMPPEQLEAMEAAMTKEKTFVDYAQGIGISSIVSGLFGAIGGAIAAKMFKKGGDEVTSFDSINDL